MFDGPSKLQDLVETGDEEPWRQTEGLTGEYIRPEIAQYKHARSSGLEQHRTHILARYPVNDSRLSNHYKCALCSRQPSFHRVTLVPGMMTGTEL